MSDNGLDFNKLVHRILLDLTLLRWFATTGGRGIAVISAIASARREGANTEAKVLDFLERHIGADPPAKGD
jgi:DNA primase